MNTWDFIPPIVRPYFVRRIAVIGAESTGKTSLAEALAERFQTVWVPEYGRDYCAARNPLSLTLSDFDAIGRGQLAAEAAAATAANRVLVCDTDLSTTCTWSDMIAGDRSRWLAQAARAQEYALTLLLDDDVPWVDDGTRVLERRRAEHTARLRRELDASSRPYEILRGSFPARIAAATQLVDRMLTPTAPEHRAPAS